jgi:hypothetical protein
MATAALKGSATLAYTPPGGTLTTHLLAIPLWEVRQIDRRARYDWWAEDLDTREVVTVGDGVREILATVRFENEPGAFRSLLRDALTYDLTLVYTESTGTYPCRLVAILGASDADETPMEPDRDRLGFGEWECRLHLRRTDGGTFDAMFLG